MKPERCGLCKGKLREGKTDFSVKVGKEIISIKDVPAFVCQECGMAYFIPGISRKIDKVMRDFHEGKLLPRPIAAGEIINILALKYH
jgi:YgiT-type zinc finger domain-containing protein